MALHPDLLDPPNFSGLGPYDCPKCEADTEPAYVQWYPLAYVLNEHGQVSTPGSEGVEPLDAPFLARNCTTCQFTWPERTADNPRPTP